MDAGKANHDDCGTERTGSGVSATSKPFNGWATIDPEMIATEGALYWLTRTGGSSGRIYKETAASWGEPAQRSEVPTAVAVIPGDTTVRAFAERDHNVVRWARFDRGEHFAALQALDLLIDDVRVFFHELR